MNILIQSTKLIYIWQTQQNNNHNTNIYINNKKLIIIIQLKYNQLIRGFL